MKVYRLELKNVNYSLSEIYLYFKGKEGLKGCGNLIIQKSETENGIQNF